ncbi:hypothetical protein BCR42DRAFT_420383 [Absidia repens]|uniref:Uncharacterized protein n=1 Tax=Absidia repens TaxID=90262 RepID=A0A1X2I9J0_9FUNG|nr:hypothetical protein BCR42DRAFT_420383 [Absidia repens]
MTIKSWSNAFVIISGSKSVITWLFSFISYILYIYGVMGRSGCLKYDLCIYLC